MEEAADHFSITRMVRNPVSLTVRVPASTSNLGPGFDCFSLALQLYLTVTATVVPDGSEPCTVSSAGEGEGDELPSTADNLIFRAMCFATEREGLQLPPIRLDVHNDVPLGRGLGSSAAAIVAGVTLGSLVCDRELSRETVLRYAFEMEGHADNVAAALYGGWVVTCVKPDGDVVALKRGWPPELKVIVVSPEVPLKTTDARSVLPSVVDRVDALYNLQRVALFGAALEARAYDHIWEAMQDRLHQPQRQFLVPGLSEILATPRQPGLVGLALSGSGPSVTALATDHVAAIGEMIANSFRRHGMGATVRVLEVDREGLKMKLGQ
ncbi:MAG: homoserine kinase [Pyrinomonadaceae bacterium]